MCQGAGWRHLLLHHAFKLLAVFGVAQHPLKGLGVAHGLRQILVQQLLHVGVPEKLVHQFCRELVALASRL